ncbi:M1-specific T cell receptor beta chain-like [Centropristis striata]|uniref:M1-specific T cell receptor beta chain-like n=1 Tax=Centropristis striata TaxID=184440 RepID=UPI0027DEE096|nr:M1-specific T cell receptor beta chain-like [Centropristis striata]
MLTSQVSDTDEALFAERKPLCRLVGLSRITVTKESIQQSPGLIVERGHSAQMRCTHTLPGTFYHTYWFQQLPGKSMKLIVHTVPYEQPDFGTYSQDKFSANKTETYSGSFTVKNVQPGITVTKESIQQSPGLIVERGHSAQMRCTHTLHGTFYHMYWFQQLAGKSMKLIVHTVPYEQPDFGTYSQDKFSANKTESQSGSFTVKNVQPGDSGVYLCAVAVSEARPAYFGQGTKLTVLDSNRTITPPTVKLLRPSQNECQNKKDKINKKTLVCVASGFYPDHVSVFWQVDGVNVTDGVATDHAALWEGEHYSITSRLRVRLSEWFTPDKKFTCTVSFFTGKETVHRSDWILGVQGPGAAAIRGKYLRVTNTAKLYYIVLIVKSCIFGIFVVFLVSRRQVSTVKQSD